MLIGAIPVSAALRHRISGGTPHRVTIHPSGSGRNDVGHPRATGRGTEFRDGTRPTPVGTTKEYRATWRDLSALICPATSGWRSRSLTSTGSGEPARSK